MVATFYCARHTHLHQLLFHLKVIVAVAVVREIAYVEEPVVIVTPEKLDAAITGTDESAHAPNVAPVCDKIGACVELFHGVDAIPCDH